MARGQSPSTDFGTVLFHACMVLSFSVLLITGLKIASDEPGLSWLMAFDSLLPADHVWFWHLSTALAFMGTLGAYAVYVRIARLTQRLRLDGARARALRVPGRSRRGAIAIFTSWALLITFGVEIATGCLLMDGFGGSCLWLHIWATWASMAMVVGHVAAHWAYGGRDQLLRVLRPSRLVVGAPPPDFVALLAEQIERHRELKAAQAQSAPPSSATGAPSAPREKDQSSTTLHSHPLVTALAAGVAIVIFGISLESGTRTTLLIKEITNPEAPILDGDLSDSVWRKAPAVTIVTQHGGGFGGTGESTVEIRAVHDKRYAYFAFVWTDPTRSLAHMPLIKTTAGWQLADVQGADGATIHPLEDKFAVLLTPSTFALIGSAISLGAVPLSHFPPGRSGRGLHFTSGASPADVWVWRASHGGITGHIDNCHIGSPAPPRPEQINGTEPYTGGLACDAATDAYMENVERVQSPKGHPILRPRRLPRDPGWGAKFAGIAGYSTSPILVAAEHGDGEDQQWWAQFDATRPYTAELDATLAIGSIAPGIVMLDRAGKGGSPVRGAARWAAGRWVLEVVRLLNTGRDTDVSIKNGVLMWVAAFDHSDTRHSYHLRPIRLEVE